MPMSINQAGRKTENPKDLPGKETKLNSVSNTFALTVYWLNSLEVLKYSLLHQLKNNKYLLITSIGCFKRQYTCLRSTQISFSTQKLNGGVFKPSTERHQMFYFALTWKIICLLEQDRLKTTQKNNVRAA